MVDPRHRQFHTGSGGNALDLFKQILIDLKTQCRRRVPCDHHINPQIHDLRRKLGCQFESARESDQRDPDRQWRRTAHVERVDG